MDSNLKPLPVSYTDSKSTGTAMPYCQRRPKRPRSTKLFAGSGYFTLSSYKDDYIDPHTKPHHKPAGPTKVRNNPHPSEAFMVYHLSKKETPVNVQFPDVASLERLIAKQQTATTYQDDYLNLYQDQGRPVKVLRDNNRLRSCKKEDLCIPHITDSTMHHDYKVPVQNSNLMGNTTRYGCNVGIVRAAHGAVPTLDKQTLPPMSKYNTLYASDFGSLRHSTTLKHKPKQVVVNLPAIINIEAHKR